MSTDPRPVHPPLIELDPKNITNVFDGIELSVSIMCEDKTFEYVQEYDRWLVWIDPIRRCNWMEQRLVVSVMKRMVTDHDDTFAMSMWLRIIQDKLKVNVVDLLINASSGGRSYRQLWNMYKIHYKHGPPPRKIVELPANRIPASWRAPTKMEKKVAKMARKHRPKVK
jgi:hypothetical protein